MGGSESLYCGGGGGGHGVDRSEICSVVWGRKGYGTNTEGRERLQMKRVGGLGRSCLCPVPV